MIFHGLRVDGKPFHIKKVINRQRSWELSLISPLADQVK
jgi:hypothetical protein